MPSSWRKASASAFEVWGNRLENKIHDLQTHLDPILTLHDSTGRELAAADNNHFADPVLIFQAPAAGTYYLQVRDTTYAGNPAWWLRAPGHDRPGRDLGVSRRRQPRRDRAARAARAGRQLRIKSPSRHPQGPEARASISSHRRNHAPARFRSPWS